MKLISVIVPIYNVEKYLNKCVDSLLSQTYSYVEIILIDDGSTDNSGNICDDYQKKYDNVIVKHIENGGQGRARNIGLSNANGEYVMFCDSDDFFDVDMIEYLYNSIKDTPEIKIAMCGLRLLFDNGLEERIVYDKSYITDLDKILYMYFNEDKLVSSPVNKIYHKSVFDNLKYPEDMIYEDRFISLPMFLQFPNIYICGQAKYNYFIRNGSTIQASFSDKNLDYLKVLEQEKKLLCDYPKYAKEIICSYNDGIEMLLLRIISSGYRNNKQKYKLLTTLLKDNIENNSDVLSIKERRHWQKYYKFKYLILFYYKTRRVVGRCLRKFKMVN